MGRRAPGRSPQGRRLFLLSCEENQRSVRALSDGDFVHRMSCVENSGRHDDHQPGDAEGADLLCLPREIRGVAAACAPREKTLRGLSRCSQQRSTHVVARGGRAANFGTQVNEAPCCFHSWECFAVRTLVRMYRPPFRAMNSCLSSSNIGCPDRPNLSLRNGLATSTIRSGIHKTSFHAGRLLPVCP
jgi:hypothetical protein